MSKRARQLAVVHMKFGIVSGGDFFKACLSIQWVKESTCKNEISHRQFYNQAVAAKAFKDYVVKKLLLLSLAGCPQEIRDNI